MSNKKTVNTYSDELITLDSQGFSRDGYSIEKWTTNNDGTGETYQFNSQQRFDQDITLYANWVIHTYSITWNSNGGSNIPPSSISFNSKIENLPVPSRPNYTFLGWYTSITGGQQISKETIITSNVIYYAHWQQSVYIVNTHLTSLKYEDDTLIRYAGKQKIYINLSNLKTDRWRIPVGGTYEKPIWDYIVSLKQPAIIDFSDKKNINKITLSVSRNNSNHSDYISVYVVDANDQKDNERPHVLYRTIRDIPDKSTINVEIPKSSIPTTYTKLGFIVVMANDSDGDPDVQFQQGDGQTYVATTTITKTSTDSIISSGTSGHARGVYFNKITLS